MTPGFRLHAFGKPELRLRTAQFGDAVLPAVQQKHLAVLTFVALSPDRRASRRVLASLLWGDSGDADDRHGLRSSLSLLRSSRALGPTVLSSGDRETIALEAPLWIDCEEFERQVGSGQYEAAVSLYRGKFFEDWAIPGCEGFEDWAAGKRNHYSALFCSAAREVCSALCDAGRAPAAVALAERIRDENPLDPTQWRVLIETRIAARDFVRAAADADSVERLEDGEGVELDKAMRVLMRRARDREWGGVKETPLEEQRIQTPEMVGREREFATLLRHWERASAGHVAHVQLVSGPGLGKSRLSSELAARLHARRARVVLVRGDVVLRGVDFGLVARLGSALSRLPGAAALSPSTASVLVGLDPSLGDVFRQTSPTFPPMHDAIRLRTSALRDLLATVSADRPLAILLDDLHWADPSSLLVLNAAFAQMENAPLLLVSSARLGFASGSSKLERLELPPLNIDSVREMLRSLAALPELPWADVFVDHIARVSRGSPFLVLQTLSLALDQGLISIESRKWLCADINQLVARATGDAVVSERVAETGRVERFALLLVGFAAGSLSTTQLQEEIAGRFPGTDALERLERRGLIDTDSGIPRVTHDEIFNAAIALADADELSHARLVVAGALDGGSSLEADRLREIGMHLLEAKEPSRLKSVFARYVGVHRAAGDERSLVELAREFCGAQPALDVEELVASLPRNLRRGSSAVAIGAALAVTAIAASTVLALGVDWDRSTNRILVIPNDASAVNQVWTAELDERAWLPGEPMHFEGPSANTANKTVAQLNLERPGKAEWAVQYEPGDSGGTEVGLMRADGSIRRLTESFGEDAPSGWSPDGRYLLISSSRWSRLRHLKTAVLDLATGHLRQLTPHEWYESTAIWSPDGTRIAFVRKSFGGADNALCWTSVDGTRERCTSEVGEEFEGVATWLSPHVVLAVAGSGSRRQLIRASIDDGRFSRTRLPGSFGPCSASMDAKWVACPPYLAMTTSLDDWRTMGGSTKASATVRWMGSALPHGRIDSVTIESASDTLPIGVPFLLSVKIYSAAGATSGHPTLVWSVDSARLASVDSTGIVTSKAAGRVTVRANLGGWIHAERSFAIAPAPPPVETASNWNPTESLWRLFGDPLPRRFATSDGIRLHLNGDGHYFSGAVLGSSLPTVHGVGFEAEVRTPVTRMQWQYLQVGAMALDSGELAAWRGTEGYLPAARAFRLCYSSYPQTEGTEGMRRISSVLEHLPAPAGSVFGTLADGRRWRVRVQVLPDGRCGIAINGVPVSLIAPDGLMPKRVHLFVQGHSVDTDILVGSVRYWTGVPTDVDWSRMHGWLDVPGLAVRP